MSWLHLSLLTSDPLLVFNLGTFITDGHFFGADNPNYPIIAGRLVELSGAYEAILPVNTIEAITPSTIELTLRVSDLTIGYLELIKVIT